MTLSNKTIQSLAIALTPEVIDYIYGDERWTNFMIEMTSDAVRENLGTNNMNLIAEIGQCIIDNIVMKPCQTT